MKRSRNAKIIATLGPASSTPEAIEALFVAGADVFRLNFSHGTHEDHKLRIYTIRELEKKVRRPIAILADLQGPKLRVGDFENGRVKLETGATFRVDMSSVLGTDQRVELPHPEIFAALAVGTELLLDDGKVRLRVEHHGADFAETRVLVGGELSNHKGLNVPNVMLPISPLTEKDIRDLEFGLTQDVDWISLSFVRSADDVLVLRDLIDKKGFQKPIIAKIEKPQAIDHLEEIIKVVHGIMVARGDLGVEMSPDKVPMLQKRIIELCNRSGRTVITATQMLESMIHEPRPTRAEASDVANAIIDGTDAIMLSGETAMGE